MLRRLRSAILVLIAAVLGAVLGRIALQARERMNAGESPLAIDPAQITLRVPDFIPGLVAAFRVKDAPWSWFHIPSWLAAFTVNFGVGVAGGDIDRLRERAERAAFDAVGLDARDFGMGGDWEDEMPSSAPASPVDGSIEDSGTAESEPDRDSSGVTWGTPPPPAPGI